RIRAPRERLPRFRGHRVLQGVIPVLLYREAFASHNSRLSLERTWASAVAEAHLNQQPGRPYLAGAVSPALAYFRRNRSTRPAVSTSLCFPVNIALMGRTSLKIVSACAQHPHRAIVGMNLFLGHL